MSPPCSQTLLESLMGQPLSPFLYGGTLKRIRALPERTQSLTRGVNRDIVQDIATYYATAADSPGHLDLVRTRQDRPPYLQRRTGLFAYREAPALLSRSQSSRRAIRETDDDADEESDHLHDEDPRYFDDNEYFGDITDDDHDFDDFEDDLASEKSWEGISVVYTSSEGVSWELGWWPDVREPTGIALFQIVLDVLTETVGACSISSFHVRDNLQRFQGVRNGLDLLREMSGQAESPLPDSRYRESSDLATMSYSFTHPITGHVIGIAVTA